MAHEKMNYRTWYTVKQVGARQGQPMQAVALPPGWLSPPTVRGSFWSSRVSLLLLPESKRLNMLGNSASSRDKIESLLQRLYGSFKTIIGASER